MGDLIDTLPRPAKLLLDSGAARSVEEALEILGRYRLHLHIHRSQARSVTHQMTLVTALTCARRCLLGGVTVSGALDMPNVTRTVEGATIADAVRLLGGSLAHRPDPTVPMVTIGDGANGEHKGGLTLRTTFDGWRGGVVPGDHELRLPEQVEFALAGCLAGAFAVAEVFAHLTGDVMAGARPVGLSLWNPADECDWTQRVSDGPKLDTLPAEFWLIGLGHLGQAYLWCIGALPYADPGNVGLVLQDVDRAGASTPSTSVLTEASDEGVLKTRICQRWCEARGFDARIVERRFTSDMRRQAGEPGLALCGVDNPDARRILEGAGFPIVFEAGLGSGAEDFRLIRMHSFPGGMSAVEVWPSSNVTNRDTTAIEARPAYDDLKRHGRLDACGITRLAQVAVGAPFVGMVAATLVVGQALRAVAGSPRATVVNLDLRDPRQPSAAFALVEDVVTFACTRAAV